MLQEHTLAAFNLALQHPVISTKQQLLCSIPRVCKAWRLAVQHLETRALSANIVLQNEPIGSNEVEQVASFASWLPKYAGLVTSIEIKQPSYQQHPRWGLNTAEQLLSLSLFKAVAASSATSVSLQAHLQPLLLQSYSSNLLCSSAVLQALPAASLSRLEVSSSSICEQDSMVGLAAALPQLSHLQTLQILGSETKELDVCMPAISQLSRLSYLEVVCVADFDTTQLPIQLQKLRINIDDDYNSVALHHLTRLTFLGITCMGSMEPGSSLPTQLVELEVRSPMEAAISELQITALQQLKRLTLEDTFDGKHNLPMLGTLPHLTHVALSYNTWEGLMDIYQAWPQVPQLCSLAFDRADCGELLTGQEFREVLSVVATLTGLTRLVLSHFGVVSGEQDGPADAAPLELCKHLVKLCNLQELVLEVDVCKSSDENGPRPDVKFVPADVQHLSSLTQLTCLCIKGVGAIVTDAAVNVLALHLKQLQQLIVRVRSSAVLPIIGCFLKSLKHLHVLGLPAGEQQAGLQYLTGLKQLTTLRGFQACNRDKLADFWAVVHG